MHRSQNWGTPIVGAATRPFRSTASSSAALSVSSVGSWALQRRLASAVEADARLSVSSVGSWALQRLRCPTVVESQLSFQYPQSDRGRCNIPPEPIQLGMELIFQYPQSDRGRCNWWSSPRRPSGNTLSVSSVGSWALQQRVFTDSQKVQNLSVSSVGSWALQRGQPARRTPHRTRTFSILSRIVGAATAGVGLAAATGGVFQYPQSDRGRCNGL